VESAGERPAACGRVRVRALVQRAAGGRRGATHLAAMATMPDLVAGGKISVFHSGEPQATTLSPTSAIDQFHPAATAVAPDSAAAGTLVSPLAFSPPQAMTAPSAESARLCE